MQSTFMGADTPRRSGSVGRGMLVGLIPLARLLVTVAIALGLTTLSRPLTAAQGFFFQQQVAVILLGVGLLAAGALYLAGCIRVMRRVAGWQRSGETAQAVGALWALGVTMLIVLLPVIVAIVLPQQPAP